MRDPLGKSSRRSLARASAHMLSRCVAPAGSALAVLLMQNCASAVPVTWIAPGPGDWGTPANWSNLAVPGAVDDVRIDGTATNVAVNTGASVSRSAANLTIDTGDSLTIGNASSMNLGGNLLGTGQLLFTSNPNESFLNFSSTTANIAAGFTIDFNYQTGSPVAGVIQTPGAGALTSDGTIRGGGTLRNIRFTNSASGLLEADEAAQLYLDPNNGAAGLFVNNGIIRALAGSTVTFAGDAGGDFISTSGQIQANGAGAIVRFVNNVSVTGGSYSTSGGGQIVVETGHIGHASNFSNSGNFTLRSGSRLNVSGTINNTGTILFTQPYANEAFLTINGPVALNGSGVVQMDWNNVGGTPAGVIDGTGTLTIDAAQTIRGTGTMRNLRVINNGLIDANNGTGAAVGGGMYLDPNNVVADLFVNNGTMRASSGGLIYLAGDSGGNFDSRTGTISAIGDNSIVQFYNNVAVRGGTYTTTGTGRIRVAPGHTGNIGDTVTVTAGSTFLVPSVGTLGATLNANGTLNLNGTLQLDASASLNGPLPVLNANGPLTIGGTGSLQGTYDGTHFGPRIDGGGSTITINSGATVRGVISFNNTTVTNNGLIDADDNAGVSGVGMFLDPFNGGAGRFVNNAAMRARNGATMVLAGDSGGDFVNNGSISVDGATSVVELYNNVSVTGGTWNSTNGGTLRVRPGHIGHLNGSVTVSSGSTFSVPATSSQTTLNTSGNFSLGGTLRLDAQGAGPLMNLTGPTTLSGSGTLLGTYGGAGSGPRIDSGVNTLTIGASNTVQGVIHFNNVRAINNGLIDANAAAGMYVDPNNALPGLFVNNSVMRSSSGGLMQLTGDNGGDFINNGTISAIGASSVTELRSNVSVSGGTWTNSGGGVVRVQPGHIATLVNPTIPAGSTFSVPATGSQTTVITSGAYAVNGLFTLDASGAVAVMSVTSPTTLSGTGTLRGTWGGVGSGPRIDAPNQILTIGSGNTAEGVIYFNNSRVVNNGTINANANGGMYVDPFNGAGGPHFINNGTMRASNNAALTLAGDNGGGFGGAGRFIVDAGSILEARNSASGSLGPVSGSGTYLVNSNSSMTHQRVRVGTLSIDNNSTLTIATNGGDTSASRLLRLNTTNSTSRMDLNDNDLLIDGTGGMTYSTVAAKIVQARNNGAWNGSGLTSGAARTETNGATMLGVLTGAEYFSVYGNGAPFDGLAVAAGDTLVKYTWYGDTDFTGSVDFDDYVRIDAGLNGGLTGWLNGDFDLSGGVDFDDYVLIDLAYNVQSGTLRRATDYIDGTDRSLAGMDAPALRKVVDHFTLFGTDFGTHFLSAVPEPGATAGIGGILAGSLLRRRGRRLALR